MKFNWVLLMEVKNDIHLLNHKRLKRVPLVCGLLLSFFFCFFFHLVHVCCWWWLFGHNPFMINKSHPKLLEMPFSYLIRGLGEIYYPILFSLTWNFLSFLFVFAVSPSLSVDWEAWRPNSLFWRLCLLASFLNCCFLLEEPKKGILEFYLYLFLVGWR